MIRMLFTLPFLLAAPAFALECEMTDTQTAQWDALGETVTLETALIPDADYGVKADLTLIRADGSEVDLGGSRKIIDEVGGFNCTDVLHAARDETLASLDADHPALSDMQTTYYGVPAKDVPHQQYMTLGALWAGVTVGQDCYLAIGTPDDGTGVNPDSAECRDDAASYLRFLGEEPEVFLEIPWTEVDSLATDFKPLLVVKRSAYIIETVALNRETNIVTAIYSEGC